MWSNDCHIGERKKMNKTCNYENCPYLCSVVWFKGSFTLLWLPFSKRKIGCLNDPLYRSNTRKYKTRKWISPYDEVEGIIRGIIFVLWDITHIHSVLNWLQHLGWRKHLFFNTSIIGIYQTRTMRVCLRIIILGSSQVGETY